LFPHERLIGPLLIEFAQSELAASNFCYLYPFTDPPFSLRYFLRQGQTGTTCRNTTAIRNGSAAQVPELVQVLVNPLGTTRRLPRRVLVSATPPPTWDPSRARKTEMEEEYSADSISLYRCQFDPSPRAGRVCCFLPANRGYVSRIPLAVPVKPLGAKSANAHGGGRGSEHTKREALNRLANIWNYRGRSRHRQSC
jgi:hypothetical protein